MDNVIPFPKRDDDMQGLEDWIASVCRRGGLSEPMIENVIDEYRGIHAELFVRYEAHFSVPDMGFDQEQVDAISKAHTKTLEGIFRHDRDQLIHAAQIILGLLARDQLNTHKSS